MGPETKAVLVLTPFWVPRSPLRAWLLLLPDCLYTATLVVAIRSFYRVR